MNFIRTLAFAASSLAFTLVATPAQAADKYGEKTPLRLPAENKTADTVGSSGGSLMRTLIGLAVVVAVIYGVTWLLRQAKNGKPGGAGHTGLATIATVSLAPGRTMSLVRAGRDLVLVGVADHGVTPIRTYTEEEARDAGLLGGEEVTGVPVGTLEKLSGTAAAPGPRNGWRAAADKALDQLRSRTVRK
jgi:flagellar protein FliO/FliZ